jgi:hypothetical protein
MTYADAAKRCAEEADRALAGGDNEYAIRLIILAAQYVNAARAIERMDRATKLSKDHPE